MIMHGLANFKFVRSLLQIDAYGCYVFSGHF